MRRYIHMDNALGPRRAEKHHINGPSAPNYDVKFEQYCCWKWQIAEELRVQRVFVALTQEFGTIKPV